MRARLLPLLLLLMALALGAPTMARADPAALLAAAEPFEELTEKAFKSSPGKLARDLAKAEAALEEVRAGLAQEVAAEAARHLADAKAALAAGMRSDLAIASVEIYRILVSAVAGRKTPVEVSLLDYAGFRYDADLKSEPRRWEDMALMAAYARARWAALQPSVTDAKLARRMEEAIARMAAAAAKRDPSAAHDAVRDELDLVDDLERHFRKR